MRAIREEVRRQEREAARRELRDVFEAAQQAGGRAQSAASAPATSLSWQLDRETLVGAIIEQLRADDAIPLTLLLKVTPGEAGERLTAGDSDGLDTVLDGLTCVIATLITVERPALAGKAITALGAIYDLTFDTNGFPRQDITPAAPEVQLRIVGRVLAAGALATRERQWQLVRALALQPVKDHDPGWWQNWLFHGEVMAARANLLQGGDRKGKSPLVIAQEHAARLDCLSPDIESSNQALMTSLCQVDMLAGFASISTPGKKREHAFLPYFAQWFASRTDPVVVELIQGGEMRDVIFPLDNHALAAAIRIVASRASSMASFIHGWQGYEDRRIQEFLAAYPAEV